MDHFMGIDSFVRHNHAVPRTFDIFGPPGISGKMAHKLASYDWNLAEEYWCSFRVHEVAAGRIDSSLFSGPEGFTCRPSGEDARADRVIFRNDCLEVAAEHCYHRETSLIYRVTERPAFNVDEGKLAHLGLVKGDWLRSLKKRVLGKAEGGALSVPHRAGDRVEMRPQPDPLSLYESIRGDAPPAAIGYIGDIGGSEEDMEKIFSLLEGVTLLVCGCSFLAGDRDKARVSRHLCTEDVNRLVDRLRPPLFLPMHLSKSYQESSARLYDELDIPPGVSLLRLPPRLTPRPLQIAELPRLDRPEPRP
jgi:ribonuclease Z